MASSSIQDYSTSPHLSIPIPNLPPLTPGAQRIPPHKHAEARQKLRQFRFAEQLPADAAPTSIDSSAPFSSSQGSARSHATFSASSASRTYPKAQSESSLATSRTNRTKNTFVFSAHDGSGLQEQQKKTLSPALRARKALLRFLGTCMECRRRRVKCSLSHHALQDLLDGKYTAQHIDDVRWALEYDTDRRRRGVLPAPSPTPSTFEQPTQVDAPPHVVIDRATRELDVPAAADMYYSTHIDLDDAHPDDSMADPSPSEPSIFPIQPIDDDLDLPSDPHFSTFKPTCSSALATEVKAGGFGFAEPNYTYYRCLLNNSGACMHAFGSVDVLLDHVAAAHPGWAPLRPDPRRLVCPNCWMFYEARIGDCVNRECQRKQELVINIWGGKRESQWGTQMERGWGSGMGMALDGYGNEFLD